MTKFNVNKKPERRGVTFYLESRAIDIIQKEMDKIKCENRSWFMNKLLTQTNMTEFNISEKLERRSVTFYLELSAVDKIQKGMDKNKCKNRSWFMNKFIMQQDGD